MDPLSISASVAGLLALTQQLIQGIRDIKGADKERSSIRDEVFYLSGLLFNLDGYVKSNELQKGVMSFLGGERGPLAQLKKDLEYLHSKICPVAGLKKLGKSVSWPFQKNDIEALLRRTERQKSLILLAMGNDQARLAQEIKDDVSYLKDGIDEIKSGITQNRLDQDALRKEKASLEIMDWLSPLKFQLEHENNYESSSCARFTGSEEFKRWERGDLKTLWCVGNPGVGKTVLATHIIHRTQQSIQRETETLAYVFCSYKQHLQTTENLICAILWQVLNDQPTVPERLVSFYHKHNRRGSRPSLQEWSQLLQTQLELFSKVTIIIDALDEYKELDSRKDFLKELEKLPSVVRFLITCRPPLPTLDGQLGNHAAFEVETREEDIRRYIEWRIPREPRLMNQVQQYPPLKEEIISSISEKAKDMILLARLHMDSIVRLRTRNRISSTLKVLPAEVNKSYDEALKRIFEQENEDAELAKAVLFWVASTSRALSISELQHAMAMHDALSPHDDLPTENIFEYQPITLPSEPRKLTLASIEGSLVEEEVLLNVCAGLVRMDEKRKTTHLVHRTLQNYLEDRIKKECPELHQVIAATCLAYLSLDDFATGYCKDDDEMGARFRDFALLKYAARYWGHHAREVQSDDSIRQLALCFLESPQSLSSAVQVMHLSEYTYAGYSQHFPSDVTPLQIAAYFNLEVMVKELIKQGANINAKDQNGWTVLHRAAENGYDSLVQILLENKADVNYNAAYGGTALHRAAKNGHEKVAKLLVKENIEIDVEDQYGGTALHRAARGSKASIVDLLVQSGAEIDRPYRLEVVIKLFTEQFPSKTYSPAFDTIPSETYNPAWGTLSAAMRFLEAAQVRTERLRGGTALHEAVAAGHISVVYFLLDHGAKVDAMDNFGGTALHRATAQGNSRIVEALLQAGADVNRSYQLKAVSKLFSSTRYGRVNDRRPGGTPLHQAAKDGNIEIGQILLRHGARCDERDEYRRTPLHVAVMSGHEKMVDLLIAGGADLKLKRSNESAVHLAARGGHDGVVALLLRKGLDVNGDRILSEAGEMPIEFAAKRGHLAVVKVLLAAGAEINHHYPSGETALMLAIRGLHSQIAVLLLENGAKFEKGRYNDLPIHAAARFGLVEVLRVLLEKGQSVDCEGSDSSTTPLEVAIRAGQEAAALFLLSKGANLAVHGECAIQAAIESNNEGLFRLLLGKIESLDWSKEGWADSLRAGLGAAVQSEKSREEGYAVGILVECLSRGVDINSKGGGSETLLLSAIYNQQRRIVEYLLDHGAKVSVADNFGRTPLFWAISRGEEQIASLLLEHGADPNIYDDKGYTPLREALEEVEFWSTSKNPAKETLITLATLLLDNGADPNIPDKKGQTVLLVAASPRHSTEFVSLLLSKNADQNIPSEDGETPLSVAEKGENHEVVKLLLKHGAQPAKQERNSAGSVSLLPWENADPNIPSEDGEAPLSFAEIWPIWGNH